MPPRRKRDTVQNPISMKKTLITIGAVVLLLAGGAWWSRSLQTTDPDVITTKGIHWHPELEVYVKGEKIEIPQNIGLGAVHNPVHTHDDLPLIHFEFPGLVTKDDTRLGNFFRVWGEDFREFGDNVTMTVNGEPNTEFESYPMKDKDKIVLRYE